MFASVSIDLDDLDCYHAIHGLPTPDQGSPIYEIAVPRFMELFDELGIRATFFVVTRYLDREEAVGPLASALAAGHELASHTHNHPYDFSKLDRVQLVGELDQAAERLETLLGVLPVGFRAPGYNACNALLDCLEERGYRYDSSVFPCPPYYIAKALVMAGMRLTGRRSGSSLTDVRGLLSPLSPYRPHRRRFHRPGTGATARSIWEIPMSVIPGVRFPVIGTSMALLGPRGFRPLVPVLCRSHPFLNIELHGIDLIGPTDAGVAPELVERQPDLRRSLDHKLETFRSALIELKKHYKFGTLAEMTTQL